jgi:outer membrane protein
MKFLALVLVSGILASYAASAAETPARVAIVSVQDAIRRTAEGKKAGATLRKEMDEMQKKMQAEGKKVQESMQELRKQGMVMDEKTRRTKEEAIQAQIMKLREQEAQNNAKFQQRDQEISAPILKKIREIVAKIAKEKGYAIAIDSSNVIYSLDQDDITDEVVKRYDAKK